MSQQQIAQTPQKQSAGSTSLSLLGFVPALVVQHFLQLPESQSLKSVVMFADISGFTNLTESLSKIGYEGSEIMAFAINRYMELLVKGIGRSGGDIFKFAGDAMIVIWPPPTDFKTQSEALKVLMRQAIQSAMDIQDKLNDTNILDKIKLSVKIGFGVGDINIIYVGGVFNRSEYLATGDPLTQAFESEHHATKGGETIVSRQVFELVNEFFDFEEIKDDHKTENGPFYYIKDFKIKKVRMKADALMIKNNLTATQFELIKPQILSYIPAALQPYVEIDQEFWSAELRRLSVMFVNLGIDLTDAKTQEGLQRIQKVIQVVQKCVYYHQGSMNKLLMDDKGSTLIVVFGLPPLSHQDDPTRAVLASFSLIKELRVIDCKCSIGIATGVVYAGVIGTSGSRREYSVLGDSVNLSARLMQLACLESVKKIICCEATASGAQHKITMKFYKFVKLKGKEKELPVFEPVDITSDEIKNVTKVELFSDIKTHQNSLILDDKMISDPQIMQKLVVRYFHMVGRNKEVQSISKILENFLKNIDPSGFIVVRGSYGIGKSLLLRVILNKLKIDEHKYMQQDQLPVIVSSLGPMTKTLKLNGMSQILKQMFVAIAKKKKKEPTREFLLELFPMTAENQEHYEALQDLVGITKFNWIENFPPKEQHVSKEKVKQEKKLILELGVAIFSELQDANAPQNSQGSFSSLSNSSLKLNNLPEARVTLSPLIVVLEDLNLYDELSFAMIKVILHNFTRVLFLSTVRDQYTEVPLKKNDEKKKTRTQDDIFSEGLQRIEDVIDSNQFHTFDIRPLIRNDQLDELRVLIRQQFNIDQFVLDREKNLVVETPEPIKRKLNDHLLFQENKTYLWGNSITALFTQYLYLRTMGNPLTIVNLVENLIKHRLLNFSEKNPQVGIITEQLRYYLDNEETISIEAPSCWQQVNGPIVDKLTCFESLLLKSASVIGDVFDIQTLNKVQPFKDNINSEKLIKILQELEALDILEVMEVSEFNIIYRFTYPFMREVIYQRMSYSQRRQIHRAVAETIQTMSHPFGYQMEQKKLEYHWIQAEHRWNATQKESDKFSHKAKRSIIVKQIQQALAKQQGKVGAILINGVLEKKSDSNISWASRYIVMTSRDFRYFYTEDDYHGQIEPLGVIQLKNIFGIYPLNEREKGNKEFAFQMSASSWQKKQQEMPLRKFFFAAQNEETLEEWTIYLEFAKAKAIYDEFVDNFGKISFPLGVNTENYDQNIRIDISSKPKKLNFGWGPLSEKNQGQSISRRASRASKAFIGKVSKPIQNFEDPYGPIVTTQQEITSLKNQIKAFLRKSTLLFYAHLFEMSFQKTEESYKKFGQNIKFMFQRKDLFDIKIDEQESPQRMSKFANIMITTAQNADNNNNLSDSNDDSQNSSPIKSDLPDQRRKSSIMPLQLESIKEVEDVHHENSENYVSELNNFERANPKVLNKPALTFFDQILSQQQQNQQHVHTDVSTHESKKEINNPKFPATGTHSQQLPVIMTTETNKSLSDQGSGKKKVGVKFISEKSQKKQEKQGEVNLIGIAIRDCTSLKGYQFLVQKGEKVLIKKIYTENQYLKCMYKGMVGILKKQDIKYDDGSVKFEREKDEEKKSLIQVQQQADIDYILSQVIPIKNQTPIRYDY